MQIKDPRAEASFKEALRLKPDYAEAHYNLGLALLQMGKKEESDSEIEKAYQLAPHLKTTTTKVPHGSGRHQRTSSSGGGKLARKVKEFCRAQRRQFYREIFPKSGLFLFEVLSQAEKRALTVVC